MKNAKSSIHNRGSAESLEETLRSSFHQLLRIKDDLTVPSVAISASSVGHAHGLSFDRGRNDLLLTMIMQYEDRRSVEEEEESPSSDTFSAEYPLLGGYLLANWVTTTESKHK